MKISVIVPVYNTANDLRKCLQSISSQTYRNLEIICVDDGSYDGSEKIVDEFAQKDSRFRVVHKANGGESSARNTGLRMSTGDCLAFCDCDDWIEAGMYECLAREMQSEKLDIAASGWFKDEKGYSEEIKNRLPVSGEVFGKTKFVEYLYKRDSYRGFAYMWNKLFKRETLTDEEGNLLLFDETLRLGGDVVYLAEAALRAERIKYIDKAFYHYKQRGDSGSHTLSLDRRLDFIRAYEMVIERFRCKGMPSEIIDYLKRFLVYHCTNAVEIALESGEKDNRRIFLDYMRRYQQEYTRLNRQYPERLARFQSLLEAGD